MERVRYSKKTSLYILSFSSHFLFSVLGDKSYEKPKYYVIACVFFIIIHFCFACLALQTENIGQKITQPIFLFLVTSSTKMKNKKWDEMLILLLIVGQKMQNLICQESSKLSDFFCNLKMIV